MRKGTYPNQAVNCTPTPSPAVLQLSCINSGQLLGQHDVVVINHQGQFYYLRQTKAGKLILTK
ncbi:hemin uptake protein HemP [Yersinia sp. 2544 StPb PI]|uniref:hemin uptake protein HemP n=1 Tax=unclassified Yersinia (in: enterobacteria) TaxID=2653513 RepID=UPI0009F7173D|nr:hemin uptake protein HemP [Yersinia enterocolitica]